MSPVRQRARTCTKDRFKLTPLLTPETAPFWCKRALRSYLLAYQREISQYKAYPSGRPVNHTDMLKWPTGNTGCAPKIGSCGYPLDSPNPNRL